jgi:hypothetical protein
MAAASMVIKMKLLKYLFWAICLKNAAFIPLLMFMVSLLSQNAVILTG